MKLRSFMNLLWRRHNGDNQHNASKEILIASWKSWLLKLRVTPGNTFLFHPKTILLNFPKCYLIDNMVSFALKSRH